jgi:hypothetical protein
MIRHAATDPLRQSCALQVPSTRQATKTITSKASGLAAALATLLLWAWQPVSAQGVPVVRDFEDLPASTPIFNQYSGVTFLGGDSSNFDGSHPVTIVQPTQPTISGRQALQSNLERGCEFCGSQLTMKFDLGQSRIALSTGLAQQGGGQATLLLQGFDNDPRVAGATLIASQAGPCLGIGPTAINNPLEIDDAAARMHFAQLALVDCTTPNNPSSGGDNRVLLIDNLVYDRPLNPPPGEHVPPVVTITYPSDGSAVQGAVPGFVDVTIFASIIESALASVTANLNGGPPQPMAFFHDTPSSYQAQLEVTDAQALLVGQNSVVVTATDFDLPANTRSATSTFSFQIKPIPPPSALDVWPTAVEVTQTIDMGPAVLSPNNFSIVPLIDGFQLSNPSGIPLLDGKRTLVRIYGAVTGATAQVDNVPALMTVRMANCAANCELATRIPPTALFAAGVSTPKPQGITLFPLGTPASSLGAQIPDLTKTWNFLLAPDLTNQDLELDIEVNEGQYASGPQQPSKQECVSGTAGECTHNNHVVVLLHFEPGPQITVHAVRFNITGTLSGANYNNVAPTDAQVQQVFDQLNEMYPAIVTRGSDRIINASPGASKESLLDSVGNFDPGTANEMFIGLLPADQATPPFSFAANEKLSDGSIVAGLASVGGRGAWADANNPVDTAHELGHNIGFDHWGCENGVTDDECGVFPIAHGGTGVVGTDIANWRVIPPGNNTSNSTPHAHDIMSYGQLCGLHGGGPGCDLGEWVSWYDYEILRSHFGVDSYDTDDPPALLVRGHIGSDREVKFLPIYEIRVNQPIHDTFPEDDTEELYTFVGRDGRGNILFVRNFEPNKISLHEAGGVHPLRISTEVPVFATLERLELYYGTRRVGEIIRNRAKEPIYSKIIFPGPRRWKPGTHPVIRWESNVPEGTAQIMYSHDGGKTLTFVARDIRGSEYAIPTEDLRASNKGVLYVQVSDGFNTGTAELQGIEVLPAPPLVQIVSPRAKSVVPMGSAITLHAQAYDPEGPIAGDRMRWSVDGVGKGTGAHLTVSGLKPGEHRVTVEVRGNTNLSASQSVAFDVGEAESKD